MANDSVPLRVQAVTLFALAVRAHSYVTVDLLSRHFDINPLLKYYLLYSFLLEEIQVNGDNTMPNILAVPCDKPIVLSREQGEKLLAEIRAKRAEGKPNLEKDTTILTAFHTPVMYFHFLKA